MTNNNLTVFEQREVLGKDFKIYGTKENPLFLAKDVAEWIEHSDVSTMLRKVDEEEKVTNNVCTLGGNQKAWFLTEDGLYEVLMQSRKPIAKEFKKQVKAILKQIRLTGGAVIENREEEFIANYFPSFSDEVKKAMVLDLKKQNEVLKTKLQEQQPKVEYHDAVLNTKNLKSITQIASDLGLLGAELNEFLRMKGVQNKQYKEWKISKEYSFLINEGYADYHIFSKGFGSVQHLKWTEKGRKWIIDTFGEELKRIRRA